MAPKRKHGTGLAKTETLSIRLEQRSRFALDFLSRLDGQSISTIIERSAIAQATAARIRGMSETEAFRSLWNPERGIRELSIAALPQLHPTFDEDRKLAFARQFWPFFYRDAEFKEFHLPRIQVIWPTIDEIIELFEKTRSREFFAAAHRMSELLKNAGLEPPTNEEIEEAGR